MALPTWISGTVLATAIMASTAQADQSPPRPIPTQTATAQVSPQVEGDVLLHDFVLHNGERFTTLKLHYTALGTPTRDLGGHITNAVLLLHATTTSGKSFLMPTIADHLFGKGQPLDVARFYVLLPDGIGFGGSSKPSDGLRVHFPHYGYIDQVEAQHAMLASIGIDHLRLVTGISQGGMQSWLWAERFPDAMDAIVPIACMPIQISGRNLMWRKIVIDAVRNDPGWHGGNYDPAHAPRAWEDVAAPMFTMMVLTPERLQASGPDRAKTLAFDASLVAAYKGRDAGDAIYDYESSSDYDPAPDVSRITKPLLQINFADDMVNPAQLPFSKETVASLTAGQFALLPGGWGHAGIFHADIWAERMGQFLNALPGWAK